jgi:hypothetical protein
VDSKQSASVGRPAASGDPKQDRAAVLEHAIETLTRRLPHAGDEEIAELVRERRAMREELQTLREGAATNVVKLLARGGA